LNSVKKKLVELVPNWLLSRIAEKLLVGDQPGLLAIAVSFDDALQAVALDVDARDEDPDAVRDVRFIRLDARSESVSFDRVALLFPGLPEPKVNKTP
jgi:hypothetical protein